MEEKWSEVKETEVMEMKDSRKEQGNGESLGILKNMRPGY